MSTSNSGNKISKPLIINYFKKIRPSHGEHEIIDLQDLYEREENPVAGHVYDLLEATFRFRTETAMDSFKELRKLYLHDSKPIVDCCNTLAAAINKAEERANKIKSELIKETLEDAIAYCKMSIKKRLNELRKINDKFYVMYKLEKNDLKILFAAKPKNSL